MSTYSVVHFFGDNSVEAVPTLWIKQKKGFCAWPKNKLSIAKLISQKSIPNEIEYDYFESRILKTNIGKLFLNRLKLCI